jgi:hypothetical protein
MARRRFSDKDIMALDVSVDDRWRASVEIEHAICYIKTNGYFFQEWKVQGTVVKKHSKRSSAAELAYYPYSLHSEGAAVELEYLWVA